MTVERVNPDVDLKNMAATCPNCGKRVSIKRDSSGIDFDELQKMLGTFISSGQVALFVLSSKKLARPFVMMPHTDQDGNRC